MRLVQSWAHLVSTSSTLEEGLALIHRENSGDTTVLPSAPTDAQMMSYIDTKRAFIVGFGIVSCVPLCVGLWLFTYVEPFFAPIALLITAYLFISYFAVGVWGKDMNFDDHQKLLAECSDYTPTVDVFLPSCGEPIEVIQNTFDHVARMEWDPSKLRVHVLDDGNRPKSIEALARQYHFNYIRRHNPGHMKKAGNLRHAFAHTDGDLIVIFDADFCPRKDFLQHTVPYFTFPDVCIVQTPQYFTVKPTQTWVERGAGSIQVLFYCLIQQNRQRFNATICVGSCAVYRRTALAPLGGTANVGFSEDCYTGFLLTDAGWRVQYLPLPLSMGTCPDEKKAFFTQNYRWCTGSLMLTTSAEFWHSNLTAAQKMCYATGGLYYCATALSIFANAVPAIVLVYTRPHLVLWYNSLFALPSLLFPFCAMRAWNTEPYGFECVRIRWLQYSAHLVALYDRFAGQQMAWQATGGAAGKTKNQRYNLALAMLLHVTLVQMLALYVGCAWRVAQGFPLYNFLPSLLVESFNVWVALQVFWK
ncbi:nucleotide-diphospho-sugar transferase [Tribonema minus]|uniref:Nucleotide-diphospho-sugar transferase n=1 Tax=Tribonema minus TaxID=303371 RepID=A0A835Z2T0_9STRA|nr:nucleotide-diphospho-sugar transferase [Tribonema minus]